MRAVVKDPTCRRRDEPRAEGPRRGRTNGPHAGPRTDGAPTSLTATDSHVADERSGDVTCDVRP